MTPKNGPTQPEKSSPPSSTDERDTRNLDRSLVHGVAWTASAKWLSQIMTWAATLFVARTLTPDDYGLVAMAMVFTSLVEMISDLGMGQAIVKHRELTTYQLTQINGLCVLLGLAGWGVTCLAAYPVSLVFETPALVPVVAVLGANFLVTSFRSVPFSLLQRDLEFRTVALNEGIQALFLSIAMVVFVMLGFGYWALVLGTLLSALCSTLAACRIRPIGFAWPRYQDLGEIVTFGGQMVVLRFCWYVNTSADQFITGKVLGQNALGAYSFAMMIAAMPLEKLTGLVMRVMPSVLSAVQQDSAAQRRYVLGFTQALSLLTLPAAVGVALVADDFVRLALGDAWIPAILPLQILSISAAYRSTFPIIPTLAAIVGLSHLTMWSGIAASIVLPIAFLVGSRWGVAGIAAVWLIVYPFTNLPFYYLVFRKIGMSAGEYLRSLWPATSTTCLMAAVVYGVHHVYPQWPVALSLASDIATGALSYSVFLFILHRARILALRDVYRLMRSK